MLMSTLRLLTQNIKDTDDQNKNLNLNRSLNLNIYINKNRNINTHMSIIINKNRNKKFTLNLKFYLDLNLNLIWIINWEGTQYYKSKKFIRITLITWWKITWCKGTVQCPYIRYCGQVVSWGKSKKLWLSFDGFGTMDGVGQGFTIVKCSWGWHTELRNRRF